ncbi:serine proteinase stubble [Scaptodrosophila lebanonensis]|uniref:CLIP domain-containing serine protease n=1 Tax=Drosophila lebanonensis TaxID=7225 RepID=A0A6J2TW72_DROLE|nr:serine proteinase stubble [Scaptodrosophila lebanonensis]
MKGLCPAYPPGYFPVITLPPGTVLTPSPSVIPTFQPTPPFPQTPPTPPTPPVPTYVPTFPAPTIVPPTLAPCPPEPLVCLPGGARPLPNCPCIDPRQQNSQMMSAVVPIMPPTALAEAAPVQMGSDMMVFMPLNATRRRRRRRTQTCFDSRARVGFCLSLASCPHLIEEYYSHTAINPIAIDFQTFLGNSICGYDGSSFRICCAGNMRPNGIVFNPRPTTPAGQGGNFLFSALGASSVPSASIPTPPVYRPVPPTTAPVVFKPAPPTTAPVTFQPAPPTSPGTIIRPSVPLPSSSQTPGVKAAGCGTSTATTNRVVGGMEARRGAYPWIAALGYLDELNRNARKYLCAGSLISNRFVATSAHCINPSLIVVRLGAHDLARSDDGVEFGIRRTVVHENFDLSTIANDIALVELNGVAPNTATIGPICLPETSSFLTQDFVGMNPFVAGWGAVKHQGPTSHVLRDVQVPIVSRQVCEQNYRSVFRFVEFSDKLICAGNSIVDACQGDSGGPLMMPQLDGHIYRFYLLGIVSFGYECARTGFPGVYTRVASYVPWIRRHIA